VVGLVIQFRRSWAGKMLVISVLVAPFGLAVFSALSHYEDGRYGINFLVFVLIGVVTTVEAALRRAPNAQRVVLLALPVVWLLVCAVPSMRSLVPAFPPANSDIDALVARLDEDNIRTVRTDYWIAYRLAFRTDERIQAGLLAATDRLPVRFEQMQRTADRTDPRLIAYVFFDNRPGQPEGALPLDQYQVDDVGPYRVYVPRPNG
jgi:4-amino-4-deoxy-L-arabinose transferase-like glycosyltransferase